MFGHLTKNSNLFYNLQNFYVNIKEGKLRLHMKKLQEAGSDLVADMCQLWELRGEAS